MGVLAGDVFVLYLKKSEQMSAVTHLFNAGYYYINLAVLKQDKKTQTS